MDNLRKEIIDIFNFRHACKKFNPNKKVSNDDFNTILEAGRLSASSFGFEPWKFLVIENAELKNKLFPIAWGAQASLSGASHFVIILARNINDMSSGSEYTKEIIYDIHHFDETNGGKRESTYANWQKNDICTANDDKAMFDWASKQTYIAAANMMTVAAILGIDSCPIEGFNYNDVENLLVNEGILDKKHFGVSLMIGFGYRLNDPTRPKTRQPIDKIVEWIK